MKQWTMALVVATFVLPVLHAEEAKKEDPKATKLLADARAARAEWHNFPGFAADLEVNIEGKIYRTPISISPKGEVKLTIDDEEVSRFARRTLGSLIGHRMASERKYDSPCAFADDNKHYPLGRAITVLNDEFHSSYRIRDRQVIVVNRTIQNARFTITVVKNTLNKEKKYLPACYVVNYWDLKSDVLRKSITHHRTWKRVNGFDLPVTALLITATPSGQEARSLKLSNHKLYTQPVGE